LECWFEGQAGAPQPGPSLELVLMGFALDQAAIEAELSALAG